MTAAPLLVLQALTNLSLARPARALPTGWRLVPVPGAHALAARVTGDHVLRLEGTGAAGRAEFRLRRPLRPVSRGRVTWRWRSDTPLRRANLRRTAADDSPARVVIHFEGGRSISYTWGNAEARGDVFFAPGARSRAIIVLRRSEDADGSWYLERRDPFADYRRAFNNAPRAILAVSIGADGDALKARIAAEIGDLVWEGTAGPPP